VVIAENVISVELVEKGGGPLKEYNFRRRQVRFSDIIGNIPLYILGGHGR
jgi:hypothetical protein